MTTDQLKNAVVTTYGQLAKAQQKGFFSKLFSCCSDADRAREVGLKIGYTEEVLEEAPEGANLGVGCGNPSALANIKLGETAIDLGSGAGFDAFILSSLVGNSGQVIGVDLSEEMLSLARRNSKKGAYANVKFVKGDIEALPLDDAIADHVLSNCVINLSLDKGSVFREAFRVLKPGGQLSISDIILEQELPAFLQDSLAGHIACVSAAEKIDDYLAYLETAGFQKIKIVRKVAFPLELMLGDPQVKQLAQKMDFNLDSEEAKDIASRVKSISLIAEKP